MEGLGGFTSPLHYARMLMGLGIRWGWTPARMRRYIRVTKGIKVPLKELNWNLKQVWGWHYASRQARYVPREKPVSKNLMAEVPMLTWTKYQYKFEIEYFNKETGKWEPTYRVLSTNNWYSPHEAIGAAMEAWSAPEFADESGQLVDSMRMGKVRFACAAHHEGWPY